ncbi:MAG: DUF3168 domain-containing protein [Proteobacteria bacterium]|nr:MAG: DUF3168 domain-containing protein [Pseudomonadota bacterium]
MTIAAAEIQKALHDALAEDPALVAALGGSKIFDRPPAGVAFPYITFGRTSIHDWSTDTEGGTEQLLTLHIWSKSRGRKQALEIMECVRARLDRARVEPEGHHLIDLRLEYAETRFDDDIDVYHGLMRFRAVTEPVA